MRIFLIITLGFAGQLTAMAEREHEVWATYRLGMVGADVTSPAMAAMREGAREAAAELERRHRLRIELDFQSVRRGDGPGQATVLQRLFVSRVSGVALVPAPGDAVATEVAFLSGRGIPVVLIKEDLPDSGRLAYIGSDERALGAKAMRAGIRASGARRGFLGLLTGGSTTPVSAAREQGALEIFEESPLAGGLRTAASGASSGASLEEMTMVMQQAGPRGVAGWVLLDATPLTGVDPLPWKAGEVGCAVIAEGPAAFMYLESGQVDTLIMSDYYAWGKLAVRLLIESIHEGRAGEATVYYPEAVEVGRENLPEWRARWSRWLR